MALPDITQLRKIIALCRKSGVEAIEMGDVKLVFGAKPVQAASNKRKAAVTSATAKTFVSDNSQPQSDELSQDALMFWSSEPASPDILPGSDQ